MSEYHELQREGIEARIGADRMAMGLSCIPDPLRGDMNEVERLRAELQALINDIGGHGHWDAQGTHGANCPICIRQFEAKERAADAIAKVSK